MLIDIIIILCFVAFNRIFRCHSSDIFRYNFNNDTLKKQNSRHTIIGDGGMDCGMVFGVINYLAQNTWMVSYTRYILEFLFTKGRSYDNKHFA